MLEWQCDMAIQRQQEMLLEAKQHRLVAEARASMERRPGWASRALCWFGTTLVSLGRWLQSRSGAAPASSGSLVFLAGHEATGSRHNAIDSLRKVA